MINCATICYWLFWGARHLIIGSRTGCAVCLRRRVLSDVRDRRWCIVYCRFYNELFSLVVIFLAFGFISVARRYFESPPQLSSICHLVRHLSRFFGCSATQGGGPPSFVIGRLIVCHSSVCRQECHLLWHSNGNRYIATISAHYVLIVWRPQKSKMTPDELIQHVDLSSRTCYIPCWDRSRNETIQHAIKFSAFLTAQSWPCIVKDVEKFRRGDKEYELTATRWTSRRRCIWRCSKGLAQLEITDCKQGTRGHEWYRLYSTRYIMAYHPGRRRQTQVWFDTSLVTPAASTQLLFSIVYSTYKRNDSFRQI